MKAGAARRRPDHGPGFASRSRAWDATLDRWTVRVQPGEFYITSRREAIGTVLGSCVSACIRDPRLGVGGMNHFMLPEDTTNGRSSWLEDATGLATRYGSHAMETLINGLLKMGAERSRLEVKLFGGGHVLDVGMAVGDRNIEFAHHWLHVEGLPVVAEDVGGDAARRIVYFPDDGRVRVRHLRMADLPDIATRESRYLGQVGRQAGHDDIELFEE